MPESNHTRRRFFLALVLIFFAASSAVQPQVNLRIGARPLGMGEAFTAIADDANAVFWNPAGLPLLLQGEVNFMRTDLYNTGISNLFA